MSTGVLVIAPPATVSKRGTGVVLSLAALGALVFVGGFAVPYFLSSSYGPPEYAPRRGWLLLHIVGGMVALLSGPIQLWLGLSDRALGWHRRIGLVYLAGV